MVKQVSNSRRIFLRGTLAVVPLSAAGTLGLLQLTGCQKGSGSNAAAPSAAQAASSYTPTYFNAEEWRFLQAACSRLIPKDNNGPGALEAGVPAFIDRQMEAAFGHGGLWYMHGPFVADTPPEFGYQSRLTPREVYRQGIDAVNQYCAAHYAGKKFAELTDQDRDHVLTLLEKAQITGDQALLTNFFTILLQNVKEGFLVDPIHGGNQNMVSWRLIGFPGARADFTDWVHQHGKAYPLPPVDIAGKRG